MKFRNRFLWLLMLFAAGQSAALTLGRVRGAALVHAGVAYKDVPVKRFVVARPMRKSRDHSGHDAHLGKYSKSQSVCFRTSAPICHWPPCLVIETCLRVG